MQGQIAKAEEEIAVLEARVADMDRRMADPAAHGIDLSDGAVYKEYEALKKQVNDRVSDWERLHNELEQFNHQ